ncbi:MAG: AbrB/MazE/SpoVT family DNA-binding domain-containing protein [Patescibacteria group bacterium]
MQVLQTNQESYVTQKGQITIPMYLRIKFGLDRGSKVFFDIEKDHIKIIPSSSLASVFGSVAPLKKKISFKEIKRIALEDKLDAIR